MPNQLRRGLKKVKAFYIDQLLNSNLYSKQELCTLTISELQYLYRKEYPETTCSKDFSSH